MEETLVPICARVYEWPMNAGRTLAIGLKKILSLGDRYVHAARYFPRIITRWERVGRWVLYARRFQISLAIILGLGLFALPAVTKAVSDTIYPAKTRRLFGKNRRTRKAIQFQQQLMDGYFALGLLVSGSMLWFALPAAARREEEMAASTATNNGPSPLANTEPNQAAMSEPAANQTILAQNQASQTIAAPSIALDKTQMAMPAMTVLAPGGAQNAEAPPGGDSDRYAIEKELGRGGMGIVYLARDTLLARTVALKSLPLHRTTTDQVERFRREAMALARLTHPNILQVFDFTLNDEASYLVMEYVKGGDLADRIAQGPLATDEALRLASDLAGALDYAHQQGVVHRDFKPENVLMTTDGNPKIMDFGLAKIEQAPNMTVEGQVMGSPTYMSPEQARGAEADHRADIYSFGVTLYEMLGGKPPFTGPTMAVMLAHLNDPPPSLKATTPNLPGPLYALVDTMLRKNPDERPSSMAAVAHDLLAIRQQ